MAWLHWEKRFRTPSLTGPALSTTAISSAQDAARFNFANGQFALFRLGAWVIKFGSFIAA